VLKGFRGEVAIALDNEVNAKGRVDPTPGEVEVFVI
jgi:hypothetical protein